MGEKERFEVLLEAVHGDVKIIAEGLVGLRREMERRFELLFEALHQEIGDLRTEFRFLAKQTDRRLSILEGKVK